MMDDFAPPRSMTFPKIAIWDLLAAHRIPYWWTRGQWMSSFPPTHTGKGSLSCLTAPHPTILEGLAPFGFNYTPQLSKPDSYTNVLHSSYAEHADPNKNLDALRYRLEANLGVGTSASTSQFSSITWINGPARIEIRITPPARYLELLENGLGEDPAQSTATCRMSVEHGWLPDVPPSQIDLLKQYEPFITINDMPGLGGLSATGTYYWPKALRFPSSLGIGTAGPAHIAIAMTRKRVQLIPIDHIQKFSLDKEHLRRSGATVVSFFAHLFPTGMSSALPKSIALTRLQNFNIEALQENALKLAAKVGRECHVIQRSSPE
ncbi:hypothetical protein [Yoonia sp. I 8.24]|uniref:hypothetical protein n=1 Tax=Yoonia sp. I 8.24 TaxID=1537229 RepID=UPI001EDFA20F|nr:hypothetical protein [Yoonia sp. I 8.24]MCG3268612.1 hypothetical protein [Yoonia sp. I 8.24]